MTNLEILFLVWGIGATCLSGWMLAGWKRAITGWKFALDTWQKYAIENAELCQKLNNCMVLAASGDEWKEIEPACNAEFYVKQLRDAYETPCKTHGKSEWKGVSTWRS